MSEIIAQRGNSLLLIKDTEKKGRLFDLKNNIITTPKLISAFLKFGDWEEYVGKENLEDLIKKLNPKKE